MLETLPDWHLIIVAGGTGNRFGGETPKQFTKIHDLPLLYYTVNAFLHIPNLKSIIVASHPDWICEVRAILERFSMPTVEFKVTSGGRFRQLSCFAALSLLTKKEKDIVLIHDAARPYVPHRLTIELINAAARSGAAIPITRSRDSLTIVNNDRVSEYLTREAAALVQTPQAFRVEVVLQAHARALKANKQDACDDACLIIELGGEVTTVEGDARNIKITYPEDIAFISQYLK